MKLYSFVGAIWSPLSVFLTCLCLFLAISISSCFTSLIILTLEICSVAWRNDGSFGAYLGKCSGCRWHSMICAPVWDARPGWHPDQARWISSFVSTGEAMIMTVKSTPDFYSLLAGARSSHGGQNPNPHQLMNHTNHLCSFLCAQRPSCTPHTIALPPLPLRTHWWVGQGACASYPNSKSLSVIDLSFQP